MIYRHVGTCHPASLHPWAFAATDRGQPMTGVLSADCVRENPTRNASQRAIWQSQQGSHLPITSDCFLGVRKIRNYGPKKQVEFDK